MASVSRTLRLAAPLDEVWAAIGGFQQLADWHPAVATCTKEMRDGKECRVLGLEGGGEIVEQLTDLEGGSYSYTILSGPLPVENYMAILSVGQTAEDTLVNWSASFSGTSDDAGDVIAGIFEAGFGALEKRFGKPV